MKPIADFFASVGLGSFDPAALLAFILALWALLLVLVSGLRKPSTKDSEAVAVLRERIDALERQISQLEGRSAAGEVKKSEVKAVEARSALKPQAVSVESGLSKSRSALFGKLSELFSGGQKLDGDLAQRFEELLIASDMGVSTAQLLLQQARERFSGSSELNAQQVQSFLQSSICEILSDPRPADIDPSPVSGNPKVVLVVGVNGAGKTTTIGKLAANFKDSGAKVVLAACDTFRAAAVEQLEIWGERVGVKVVSGAADAKPTTVAYQAVHEAQNENADVLIIDTAGRLHTRTNLMNELRAVTAMIEREQSGAPHETILVVDGSSGQNALQQARQFNEAAKLTGVIITKLDGTPKGGIVVAIRKELGIPVRYIGIGEGLSDLRKFDAAEFAKALFAGQISTDPAVSDKPFRSAKRTRRA